MFWIRSVAITISVKEANYVKRISQKLGCGGDSGCVLIEMLVGSAD